MPRTPYLTPDEMTAEQLHIYEDIVASRGPWADGPFAPMLHQPRIAEPAQKLGKFLRYEASLTPRLTELAIIVVARHWDCDFEWCAHAAIALRSEVPAGMVEAVRLRRRPTGAPAELDLVYEFTKQLLERHRIEDAIYDRAKATWGIVGVVELTGLIGYYTLIALTLNAHEVGLPVGVSPPFERTVTTRD